jgi:hypothetical protein
MVKLSLGVILLSYNGISRKISQRLNTDGSLDTSFNVGKDQTLLLYIDYFNFDSIGRKIILG